MCLRFQFCTHQRVCILHFLKKSQIRCTLLLGSLNVYKFGLRLHRLAELIPWNRFLGSLKVYKFGLRLLSSPLSPGHLLQCMLMTKFAAVYAYMRNRILPVTSLGGGGWGDRWFSRHLQGAPVSWSGPMAPTLLYLLMSGSGRHFCQALHTYGGGGGGGVENREQRKERKISCKIVFQM